MSEAESYQHPAFKIDEGELTKLLEEAEKAEELLAMPDYSPGLLVRPKAISRRSSHPCPYLIKLATSQISPLLARVGPMFVNLVNCEKVTPCH